MTKESFLSRVKVIGLSAGNLERALNDYALAWIEREKSRYYRAYFQDGSIALYYGINGRITRVK